MKLNIPKFDGILNFIMLTDRAGKKGKQSLYITTENKAKNQRNIKMPINKNKLFKTNSVTY